jgi:hypothetical protein
MHDIGLRFISRHLDDYVGEIYYLLLVFDACFQPFLISVFDLIKLLTE